MRKFRQNPLLTLVFVALLCTIAYQWTRECEPSLKSSSNSLENGGNKDPAFLVRGQKRVENYENGDNEIGNKVSNQKHHDPLPEAVGRDMPLIFIGGVPRSGKDFNFPLEGGGVKSHTPSNPHCSI